MVALKKVRVPLTEEGVPMSTLREISLLKQMEKYEHPNIVRLVFINFLRKFNFCGNFGMSSIFGIIFWDFWNLKFYISQMFWDAKKIGLH